ncbi:MAG: HAMP domain-containing protein [Deltaproteobacteria bacterium]|nr:HAMP domain-containing protein [Deltaproteobacteria bacterium]
MLGEPVSQLEKLAQTKDDFATEVTASGWGIKVAHFVLQRTPLGGLVRWVAGIKASVHAKLITGFIIVTLLVVAMGGLSLRAIDQTARQSLQLDEAHKRVEWSRQIQNELALQMNFTAMALLLKDEATVAKILRANNRFNNFLALIGEAAVADEQDVIERIRSAQGSALTTVADIANLLRDGKASEAMSLQQSKGYPLYEQIAALVDQVVEKEQAKMAGLRADVAAATRRTQLLMAAFIAIAILLALLLGFVISWSFIMPVQQAHGFLAEVAKGNFQATIDVPNRDEFGVLADRMNHMSQELHRLYEKQRDAGLELQRLNGQLTDASKAKSEFLANMSHELRTPMNAILGFIEMILDDLYGDVPAELREPLSDIQINGRHLLNLINDVLDLSKIEAGRMELALSEYSVQDVIEVVCASLQSLAAEKGLKFSVAAQPEILLAYGDGKRIAQCLLNLAGNALKFTKQGQVEIGVEQLDGLLRYRVSDTGIGIPPDQLEKVFGGFRQVDAAITREYGGTGLGLSITKKFVELHGGRIWVESDLGQGSRFFFEIPLRCEEGTAP